MRPDIKLFNMDCMALLSETPDKAYQLAICDPPYFKGVGKFGYFGEKVSNTGVKRGNYTSIAHWDENIPSAEYYAELLRVSEHQIIWGCNYYPFLQPPGRIVWDKKNETSSFSNCELASISLINSVKIFRYEWNGMLQENMKEKEVRIHQTQKPVALYKWLLRNYAKPGDKILDTHLGSGSIAIACHDLGFDLTATEIDKEYYDAAVRRYDLHRSQLQLPLSA